MISSTKKAHGKKFVVFGGSVERINALERMLFFAGGLVEAATSAQKGLAFMRNMRPDIVIIDDSVLDATIEEIASEIRQDPLLADVAFIFITSAAQHDAYTKLFSGYRVAFVDQTDFDVMNVILTIEQLLLSDTDEEIVFDFSEEPKELSVTPSQSLRLLVVEDDPLLRNLLTIKLQKSAIIHEFCHSGTDALSHIETFKPSVVVLDLMLPGKGGLDILAELRSRPDTQALPVIIFSNKDDDEDRLRAQSLGVSNFLVKAMTDLSDVVELIIKLGSTR